MNLLFQTWELQSTNGQAITLTFESFDTDYESQSVEVNDGTSTQEYWGPVLGNYSNGDDENLGPSIPGPFTSNATIKVKFSSGVWDSARGFLAVICCSVHVITDLTSGELINIFITFRTF